MKIIENNNNSKKSLLITLIVLALVVGVAAVIYNVLPKDTMTPGLVSSESESPKESDSNNTPEEEHKKEQEATATKPQRAKTPDFTVEDINGNKVKLSDFREKPVIINFWASWCRPCKSEMPDFEELYKEYGNDIHFLMVNMTDGSRETKKKAQEYIEAQGFTFPVYFDTSGSAAYAYRVSSIPATHFIDSEGYHVVYGVGALNKATLMQGIGMLPEYAE